MADRITIRRPDDWHLHVRDGAMLKAVVPFTARHFGRAIIMPNLVPPVTTVKDAVAYRTRVMAAVPEGADFRPLMTCYLTDETNPDDVEAGFRDGVFTAVKLYPVGATTNSAYGVTDFARIRPVLARMEKIGMRLLVHGEEAADPSVDVFDREAVFIEQRLAPMTREYPGLRIVLEHVSSKVGVEFVRAAAPRLGGTITPYHLLLNRTDMLGYGIRPYYYCMPVLKRERDRLALLEAATSGESCFFLGTDSAPHPVAAKLAVCGCAGLFNSPVAIETYAKAFDAQGALDRLEAFASLNGPAHYGLPANEATITLERVEWTAPEEVPIAGPEERAIVFRGGETIEWRVVAA
ncbi:MAG TPA: dihydroorotase [Alphaproteobacteria bacterium]